MNKKQVEKYIPTAIDGLEPYINKWTEKGKVSTFAAKINAFGPVIISMGVKPAAALYAGGDSENEDRQDVAKLALSLIAPNTTGTLSNYVKDMNTEQLRRTRTLLFDAIIALKLAARTYKLDDKKKPEKKPAQSKDEAKQEATKAAPVVEAAKGEGGDSV